MSCDHELVNEWARCSGKNASYMTRAIIRSVRQKRGQATCTLTIEIWKIGPRRSRSSDRAELGHFTLLFCRGRQNNEQRTVQLLFCSLNLLFSDVLVSSRLVGAGKGKGPGNEVDKRKPAILLSRYESKMRQFSISRMPTCTCLCCPHYRYACAYIVVKTRF